MNHTRYLVAERLVPRRGAGEDRLATHRTAEGLVVVVADGAGGLSGGAAAAERVMRMVAEAARDPAFPVLDERAWAALLRRADQSIERDRVAGETTAVVVSLGPASTVGAFAGDSEAWLVRDHGIDELTRKAASRARLGSGRASPATFARGPLEGLLVVGSDGLFGALSPTELASLVAGKGADEGLAGLLERLGGPGCFQGEAAERTGASFGPGPRVGRLADDLAVVLVSPGQGGARRLAALASSVCQEPLGECACGPGDKG